MNSCIADERTPIKVAIVEKNEMHWTASNCGTDEHPHPATCVRSVYEADLRALVSLVYRIVSIYVELQQFAIQLFLLNRASMLH